MIYRGRTIEQVRKVRSQYHDCTSGYYPAQAGLLIVL
jgi:hypothetical protein